MSKQFIIKKGDLYTKIPYELVKASSALSKVYDEVAEADADKLEKKRRAKERHKTSDDGIVGTPDRPFACETYKPSESDTGKKITKQTIIDIPKIERATAEEDLPVIHAYIPLDIGLSGWILTSLKVISADMNDMEIELFHLSDLCHVVKYPSGPMLDINVSALDGFHSFLQEWGGHTAMFVAEFVTADISKNDRGEVKLNFEEFYGKEG